MRLWRALALGLALAAVATPALADPITIITAVVTAFELGGPIAAAAILAIDTAFVVAGVVALKTVSKFLAPSRRSDLADRQASILQLSMGEGPCEALVGEFVTGGAFNDGFYYGGENGTDWNVLVIELADHRCEDLVGTYVNEVFEAYTTDGAVAGYNGQLEIYWREGTEGQSVPSLLTTYGGRTSDDNLAGVAYVVVAYKIDDPNTETPVWTTGRPTLKFRVKGLRCYDPRKDSTVSGGSGAHRWSTPSTWEWTQNAALIRYNWVRGIYACDRVTDPDQKLIGRGLSATLAPPERVFAAANVCDENVALLAGGTEKRYRANGIIRASDDFRFTEDQFAAAMAGILVQREGGIEVEPGQNKSAVGAFTDADIVTGTTVKFEPFAGETGRVNTVAARYVEPEQNWTDHSAPIRQVLADVTADGGVYDVPLDLGMVTSGTQAQRCAEIKRRRGGFERSATVVLPPRFAMYEEGDWLEWTSERRFAGNTFLFEIQSWGLDEKWRLTANLREVSSTIASWTAAVDEAVPGAAPPPGLVSPDALELSGVVVTAVSLNGVPALKYEWDTPVDSAISSIRFEVRVDGDVEAAHASTTDVNAGVAIVTAGVASDENLEGRAMPLGDASRDYVPSAWDDVTSDELTAAVAASIVGQGALATEDEVDTTLMAVGAATAAVIVTSARTPGAGYLAYGVETDVVVVNPTPLTGSTLRIDFAYQANMGVTTNDIDDHFLFKIYRSSSGTPTDSWSVALGTGATQRIRQFSSMRPLLVQDPGGSETYKLTVTKQINVGIDLFVSDAKAICVEHRKAA